MVDFGGVNVKELTQGTKDGILDLNSFRSLLASATNPLATISDVNRGNNLLINGSFRFAQRQVPGTLTTYSNVATGWVYGADRWGITNENASVQYQRVDSAGAPESGLQAAFYGKFKKITSAGKMIISQVLEGLDSQALRGQTVRFQVKMRYSVAASMKIRLGLLYVKPVGGAFDSPTSGSGAFVSAFGAVGTDPTWHTNLQALAPTQPDGGAVNGLGMDCVLTGGWVRYSACFVIPSNLYNIIPVIWTDGQPAANDELNIAEAGLYLGQGIMPWAPRPEQQEMALCQRYYSKSFDVDQVPAVSIGPGQHSFPATNTGATQQVSPTITFPVPMRMGLGPIFSDNITEFTLYSPNSADNQPYNQTGGHTGVCSAASTVAMGQRGFGLVCTGNAGAVPGNLIGVHWVVGTEFTT